MFRRTGVRTQTEVDYERYALKALRGDFEEVPGDRPPSASQAAERALQAGTS